MTTVEILVACLTYFARMDESNAAVHVGEPRWSPLTFRIAEQLDALLGDHPQQVFHNLKVRDTELLDRVLADRGAYAEDRGR